jgi:hypothetical protein
MEARVPLDPIHKGVRVYVTDSTASGWKYRDRSGTGIVKVVPNLSRSAPELIPFSVKGRNGSWPVSPSHLPVRGTVVIDAPNASTGARQCRLLGIGAVLFLHRLRQQPEVPMSARLAPAAVASDRSFA